MRKFQEMLDRTNSEIDNVSLRKKVNARQLGEGHPSNDRIKLQLESLQTRKDSIEEALAKLRKEITAESSTEAENAENKGAGQENTAFHQAWIKIYAVTLQREQRQHETAIEILDEEYKRMETRASEIRQEMAELNLLKSEVESKELVIKEMMKSASVFKALVNKFSETESSNDKSEAVPHGNPIVVVIGESQFFNGDHVKIESVTSSGNGFEKGATITVSGIYTLNSLKTADLCFYSTGEKSIPTPELENQRITARNGTHAFALSKVIGEEGNPHLTFYHPESGKPFGGIYFGDKSNVLMKKGWEYNAP